MKQNVSLCLSVLLLLATGCTYNRVCYDPNTGFHSGGGVEIQCGGPLDPWMKKCCPPECQPGYGCTAAFCCAVKEFWRGTFCYPPLCAPYACPSPCASNICSPPCASGCAPNVCPPTCASPVFPGGVAPFTPLPTAPAGPMFQSNFAPTTFAAPESCATCGPTPSVGGPVYSHPQSGVAPAPGVTNYPQLFNQPPLAPAPAPPASAATGDQFLMPTPIPQNEIPPTADQLPPKYELMDPPTAGPMPTPQAAPMQTMPPANPMSPMNPMPPMGYPVPAEKPMPMPMPNGTPATQTSYPTHFPPGVLPTGMIHPTGAYPQNVIHDSRRQQWVPVRM